MHGTSNKLHVTSYKLQVTSYLAVVVVPQKVSSQRVAFRLYCMIQVTSYKSQVTSYKLQVSTYKLQGSCSTQEVSRQKVALDFIACALAP